MITFLQCSCNNASNTVLDLFNNAVHNCGCPSRIRTDKGTLIWEKMVEMRGENRESFIAGSSVHNQHIERL